MMNPPTFAEIDFRKATASQPAKSCVQVARRDGWVVLRDDKTTFGAADDHHLVLTAEEFDAFLVGAREGRFDGLPLQVSRREDGFVVFQRKDGALQLTFTEDELIAFLDGIEKNEFSAAAFA